jgi:hypothetical protein
MMLIREEEGPSEKQLVQVVTYDDAMWINGMTEELPTIEDIRSDGRRMKETKKKIYE